MLLSMLEEMRKAINKPIVINSGHRCLKHNAKVGGEANSAHLRGKAVDVYIPDSGYRMDFVFLARLTGFFRIGVYSSWVHLDNDITLPQNVMWVK